MIQSNEAHLQLTTGQIALIDSADYERVSKFAWHLTRRGYVRNRTVGFLHRFIVGASRFEKYDHANLDRLDCRRSNIRLCTPFQNQGNVALRKDNSSGFKGVSWDANAGKWRASIQVNRRMRNIGRFDDLEDAAKSYDVAARRVFGEFARLNFPMDGESSARITG